MASTLKKNDRQELAAALELLDTRLRWLSAWTIHNANHLREKRDGLKVGGHQASCASMTAIMAALYFHALRPNDKVAVKPHAGPVLHAIHYLLGNQTLDKLKRFRGLDGVQSYPSRTKDVIPVDFSTGSVGLGVAATAFSSLVQDYLIAHGQIREEDAGRMIALMGDAELDEGNIYECLIEGYKHDLRNCWWVVDYNRQSLDSTTADRMFRRFDDIFETCGWRVITLKYGKMQQATFRRPGGKTLEEWIDNCPNAEFAALTFQGGAAWRARLMADIGDKPNVAQLIDSFDDEALARLMVNLGGHCIETLLEAFESADDDRPTLFIAYTVKGFGLPLAGHKDNHSGMMNPPQIAELRASLGIAEGEEWEPWAGLGDNVATQLKALVESSPIARKRVEGPGDVVPVPARLKVPDGNEQSTQAAFGRILLEIAKSGDQLADRIVTTAPDVTQTTNLGAFVNQRGLFRRQELADVFQQAKIPSAQKWQAHEAGQHIELGIAENNFFLMLNALGLAAPHFGTRLLPVGTVYDPFIARGLSVYLRLSTRAIGQVAREDAGWEADALQGGYWLRRPAPGAKAAIVFTGVVAPEALSAWEQLADDLPGLGLLNITSPDLLHRGWSARRAARWTGKAAAPCHAETLLSDLAPGAGLVTVIDGSPGALSWLGGVKGMRVSPLGVDRFGQTGDLPDLYRTYRLDAEAIIDAAAELCLEN
ncbi:MAG: transketolase [Sphingobium sp. 32-64-5]|nr:MAG: transketolase [Sphingobium sp. 32-64-5]